MRPVTYSLARGLALLIFIFLQTVNSEAKLADAQSVAYLLKPARTAKDFLQAVNDPKERTYLKSLLDEGKIKNFKRPDIKVDTSKNTLTLSGSWGKLIFDYKNSDKSHIQINGKKYPLKAFYKVEEFNSGAIGIFNYFFLNQAFADDGGWMGWFFAQTASVTNYLNEVPVDEFPYITNFTCNPDNTPKTMAYGENNDQMNFEYNKKDGSTTITITSQGGAQNECVLSFDKSGNLSSVEDAPFREDGCFNAGALKQLEDKTPKETISDFLSDPWTHAEHKTSSDVMKEIQECCASPSCFHKVADQIVENKTLMQNTALSNSSDPLAPDPGTQ